MAAGSRRARGQAPRLAVGGAPEPDGRTRSAQGRSGSAAAMSLSTGEPASEMGDDSLSAITFDSDSETKAKRKSFHRPPPTSPKSPYHSKPRKVASWRSLRTAGSAPLGSQMSLTPQKLWLGSSKQGYVPGTPVYREMEGMYDEIIELKKSLHVHKSNMDLMRTKLRRLEEENSRKDRQIEQLLDPSRGPDFVRTLAEKRPDTGWVISGLKQRILKLEQQCKEKNHTIDKLQTDMKTTNLEEMRIAMETYYEEIHRLQTLLASSETTGKKPPVEKNVGLKRQKRMSSALLSLSRSVQELTEENQSLKEDLDRVLSDSPTVSKIKGSVEWSKPRLLRRIAELEKKISLMESPKSHASEVVLSTPPAHSVSSSTVHRQPRPDRQEESERLRGVVKSLKGERNALHTRLQERDLEVKQLLQIKADLEKELENMKEGEKEGREREEALREEIQALTRKFQELEESKKGGEEDPEETSPETREAPRPPGPSQTDSELDTSEGGSSRPLSGCSEGRRDAAARLLQRRWKGHQHWKKQAVLDEDSPEPRVPSPVVQAEGDPWQEEAITIIQSAFRAHLARARHSAAGPRAAPAAFPDRPAWAPHSAPSSPPFPAASPGQEDSEGSSGETAEAPAPRDGAPRPWGPGAPAAPLPCSAEPPPSGPQRAATPPAEDVNSDDSDEIVLAPPVPTKKIASPP
ncbi:IQ domain-containing protein E isoform X5 [Tursiops truncatus]|uniref:IQ domain-containing protein E isoform X5 n=1 Tax=Tursiops truncatus TaxID=9739 RepID=UPI003CCF28D2